MRFVSDLLLIVLVVVSAAWCISNPSYEPALALIAAIMALFARAVTAFQGAEVSFPIGRFLLPFIRWRHRRTPRAELEFDSLRGTRAIHHCLKAWSVWDRTGPSTWIELRHRQDTGSWTTPYRFEGHSIDLSARDIDGDGHPEVVVIYSCGAHTRVVNIFKVGSDGFLVSIPGSEIGSDWPEIVLEDKDNDGKVEVYAKQRDWRANPVQDPVTEVHVYCDGKFEKYGETLSKALQETSEDPMKVPPT